MAAVWMLMAWSYLQVQRRAAPYVTSRAGRGVTDRLVLDRPDVFNEVMNAQFGLRVVTAAE